jgi:hypothetical protein
MPAYGLGGSANLFPQPGRTNGPGPAWPRLVVESVQPVADPTAESVF